MTQTRTAPPGAPDTGRSEGGDPFASLRKIVIFPKPVRWRVHERNGRANAEFLARRAEFFGHKPMLIVASGEPRRRARRGRP
jgi:hypothetical protein